MKLALSPDLIIDFKKEPYKSQGLVKFICGMRGSGKSYEVMKCLEEAYEAGLQFIFLDPHGEGHVLADKSFAKHGSVVVASERYGVPIDKRAIPVYIDILKQGTSLVLDLSKYFAKSKSKFNDFALEFIREFYGEWSDIRRPILLVFDEAHHFAPQRLSSDAMERIELIEEVSTSGRKYGINLIFSTQRPALISKTPISQANLRLIGKLEGKNDWDAVKEYVVDAVKESVEDTVEEPVDSTITFKDLRAFLPGDFVASISGKSTVIHISERKTRDAGATPEAGAIDASFSKNVELEIGDLAEKIRQAISESESKVEEKNLLQKELKSERAKNERLEETLDSLNERFKILEFVSSKMSGSKPAKKGPDSDKVIKEKIQELRKQYESEIHEKDTENASLQLQVRSRDERLEKVDTFVAAFKDLVGPINGENGSLDIEDLVKEVSTRLPQMSSYQGGVIELAPLPALKTDWEKRIKGVMMNHLQGLSSNGVLLLSYLLSNGDAFTGMKRSSNRVFGPGGGPYSSRFTPAVNELKGLGLIVVKDRQGIKQNLKSFVESYLGDHSADIDNVFQHTAAWIRDFALGVE